jgi:GT2 family glycosyltransferase
MPERTSRRKRHNPYAGLIHLLNQRYQDEWRRAEAIQEELDCIRGSGFWKAVAWVRALKQHLWPVRPSPAPPLTERAVPFVADVQDAPLRGRVSIIIPFRDRPELLRNCVRSLRLSTYRDFEVILVDNGSVEPQTRRLLSRLRTRKRFRIVSRPAEFNFSRLCNAGAAEATGTHLLFLNNDTEVLSRDWLENLLRLAGDPRVGAVGATLLYPNRTIQHAGIFPRADGQWVHPYRGYKENEPGENGELRAIRSVPAVTGACLIITNKLFQSLGGFDERYPVAHNDVDLCERLRRDGLLVVISPHARLFHYEGLSRGIGYDAPAPSASAGPQRLPIFTPP